jgi:hypothetical protein
MLIEARQWIRETFVQGSRPRLRDVRQWVESGELAGEIWGDRVYVDDTFATAQRERVKPRTRIDLLA